MNNQRVIKFRVWDGKRLTYADSYRGRASYDNGGHPYLAFYLSGQINDHISLIIQQFTGLQTRNGRDVYEGDILNTKAARWQVIFENGAFVAKWIMGIEPSLGPDVRHNLSALLEHAILIGNVCENPELVKENTL